MRQQQKAAGGEQTWVDRFARTLCEAGHADNAADIIDVYVALKSKPMAILAGPAAGGKTAFVRCLAQSLLGNGSDRFQMMLGHPWWAGGTDNLVAFTNAQQRFTAQKLACMVDEASLPENRNRLFIGCLARISPGELVSIFGSLTRQIAYPSGAVPGPFDFTLPSPWPPNLLLVGTLDTPHRYAWDEDVASSTSFFRWGAPNRRQPLAFGADLTAGWLEKAFLLSAVRHENQAYQKLHALFNRDNRSSTDRPVRLLLVLTEILEAYQVPEARAGLRDAIIYLANAWSDEGVGLFHPSIDLNLRVALDRAISHNLLPRALIANRPSRALRRDLYLLLARAYPRSVELIDHLTT